MQIKMYEIHLVPNIIMFYTEDLLIVFVVIDVLLRL